MAIVYKAEIKFRRPYFYFVIVKELDESRQDFEDKCDLIYRELRNKFGPNIWKSNEIGKDTEKMMIHFLPKHEEKTEVFVREIFKRHDIEIKFIKRIYE